MRKIIAAVVLSAVLVFTVPILFVFLGALSGWVAGLVFEDMIMGFLSRIGVNTAGLTMWQLGGALGFIGSFFKTSISQKTK